MIVMALGLSLIIASGHIDLSMGSVCGLAGAFAAVLMVNHHMHYIPATLLTLAIGALIGGVQGYLVAYLRMPAFLVTLAFALICRGLTYNLLPDVTLGPMPAALTQLGAGWILDPFVVSGFHVTTFVLGLIAVATCVSVGIRRRLSRLGLGVEQGPLIVFIGGTMLTAACGIYILYSLAQHHGLPTIVVICIALTLLYTFIASRTVIGRGIFAAGGNEKAAKLSGIRVNQLVLLTFVNMGVLTTLAGLIIASRSGGTATRSAGAGIEFDVITACLIGSIFGSNAAGKVLGAVIGALLMGSIDQAVALLGMNNRLLLKGCVLLFAVGVDQYYKRNVIR